MRAALTIALVRVADDHGHSGSADCDRSSVVHLQRHVRGGRRSRGVRALTVRDGGAGHDPDAGAGSAARDRDPGADLGWRLRIEAPIAAAVVGFSLFYFVTLTTEPIWIGWRSGQILLVTLPALAATTIAQSLKHRVSTVVVRIAVVISMVIGLPTALIDLHNAQDVENAAMGPGFRWTVVMSPDSQAAVTWIRENTPPTRSCRCRSRRGDARRGR